MPSPVVTQIPLSLREAVFDFPGCHIPPEEQEPALSALMGAIAALSPLHRQIIELRFYQGLSTKEAAAKMGYSQSFVGSRQRQALHYLRIAGNGRFRGMVRET